MTLEYTTIVKYRTVCKLFNSTRRVQPNNLQLEITSNFLTHIISPQNIDLCAICQHYDENDCKKTVSINKQTYKCFLYHWNGPKLKQYSLYQFSWTLLYDMSNKYMIKCNECKICYHVKCLNLESNCTYKENDFVYYCTICATDYSKGMNLTKIQFKKNGILISTFFQFLTFNFIMDVLENLYEEI